MLYLVVHSIYLFVLYGLLLLSFVPIALKNGIEFHLFLIHLRS